MQQLSVMIVDDEILAIEHLKRMIDWESEGFRVIGESIRPLEALTKVAELMPDLIITDIRMPHLDGIEFTKRVFAAGHRCKVILLTSYKEFDYVKEAIGIGVTQYLVKHELEAENLCTELRKVKVAVDEERQRSSIVVRQYLKELTDGNTPPDELALAAKGKLKGSEFTYVLLALDDPFPVLPVQRSNTLLTNWDGSLPSLPLHEIEIACKGVGHIGFLLMSKQIPSKRKAAENHVEAVSALRRYLQDTCSGRRVVAAYSEPFATVGALSQIHRNAMTRLTAALVFDAKKLTGPFPAEGETASEIRTHDIPAREAIVALLDAGGNTAFRNMLDEYIGKAAGMRSISYLSELCGSLVSGLDSVRASRGLPLLRELAKEGMIQTDQWRSLEGIKTWLSTKAEETMSAATNRQYSRKVREAIEYITAHCAEELSAESIAFQLGISGEHLRHLFKQETGRTLLDFITMHRMERAKSLLESGSYKIYEISEKVGYRSSHYFSKIFSKCVGISPLDYAEARGRVQ